MLARMHNMLGLPATSDARRSWFPEAASDSRCDGGANRSIGCSSTARREPRLERRRRPPSRVPSELQVGEPMLKVTSKKVMQRVFRLDAERGQILWASKKNNKGANPSFISHVQN